MRARQGIVAAIAAVLAGCGGDSESEPSAASPAVDSPPGLANPPPVTPSPPAASNAPPTLTGTPATIVWEGSRYSFVPFAFDPDGDRLVFLVENAPAWSAFDTATGRLSGVPTSRDVGDTFSIRIGVSDGQHAVWLPKFDLSVRGIARGSVLLSWQAPTQNTDGTPLRDLAGFKIHWGKDPKWHTETLTIAGTGITDYRFTGLSPGLYYFATTAVSSLGIESERSDVATILVR